MVLRSIKPIKAGDIVYENYGPFYTNDIKQSRINEMVSKYKFSCTCHACVEDWPLLADFDANVLRVRCECGGVVPTSKDIPTPSITCEKCNKDINLLPVLTGLIVSLFFLFFV